MTEIAMRIGTATAADLDAIVALQASNQTSLGGMLSAEIPRFRIEAMMQSVPMIVVRREHRITGFLMAAPREMNADLPVVQAMFNAYPGAANAYVYGPICVAQEERGKGLAAAMFSELRRLEPGREGVLFIRGDNVASLRLRMSDSRCHGLPHRRLCALTRCR
jgi:predicted GNAT superfamily acetyltransferase